MEFPNTLQMDFDTALRNFNFVAGVAYRKDNVINIPLYHGPDHWVCDCLQIPDGAAWQDAEIFPVRAEDVGAPEDYRPGILKSRVAALGRTCDL